ncbi:hypothetical protein TYRP_018343, partial [Tyrophagus putrescentiae]
NEVRKKSTQSKWFTHIQSRKAAHSNKHYLYVFTFQSDYDFFVGNKHQHLGLITTEPFPNPIIDSMIYRNEQLIKFTIKNVFCEPINDHQKKLIKLFHYHIMEHFIPKLFNSKEKNDYLSSYLNFPDLTLYFVLVNLHNATTFSIDFDLFEELRTWTHQINQYHKTRSQPLQNGYTDEQVSEQFPPQTLILPFHQKKFTLHIVSQKEQSTKVYPKKKFMHCPKKEESRDDRKNGKKTPSENSLIEIDYIEYYREKYGISLEHTTVQLVSALRLSQLLQRNLQYSVSHKSSKAVYEEFKGGGGGGGSEKIHHQYYPPELVSVYPLTVHAVSLISAILPIVHRLEQFHLANDLLEEVFGGSQQHTLRLNNEPSCESLITEALFGNMKMTKCNDKTNLAVSRTTKIKTESVETDQSNQQTLDSANQPELHFGDSLMLMFAGDITEHIDITFDTFDEFLCPSPWVLHKTRRPSKADFARLIGGQIASRVIQVDDLHLHIGQQVAEIARLKVRPCRCWIVKVADVSEELRTAVHFVHVRVVPSANRLQLVGGNLGATVAKHLQAAQVEARVLAGGEARGGVCREGVLLNTMAVNKAHYRLRRKDARQKDGHAAVEGGREEERPGDVAQRKGQHQALSLVLCRLPEVDEHGEEGALRVNDALRLAAGARGVEDGEGAALQVSHREVRHSG